MKEEKERMARVVQGGVQPRNPLPGIVLTRRCRLLCGT